MAPLETIWPELMHSPPTKVAYAAMLLAGVVPLTSGIAMLCWIEGKLIETLNELADACRRHGLSPKIFLSAKETAK